MTLTDQLAAALRDVLPQAINDRYLSQSAAYARAEAALAAFDAQPAADDGAVERVARIIHTATMDGRVWGELASGHLEHYRIAARAALAAMAAPAPAPDGLAELRVGDFVLRHAANGIWIGRTSGEGGEFATEHVERVIAQFYREQF